MLASSLMLARQPTLREARRVLLTSVIYLPILLVLIVLDAGWRAFFQPLEIDRPAMSNPWKKSTPAQP
jgi:hypothetical protein